MGRIAICNVTMDTKKGTFVIISLEPAPSLDEDLSNDGGSDSTEDGFDDMDDFGWDDEEWGDDDWDEDDWGDQGKFKS